MTQILIILLNTLSVVEGVLILFMICVIIRILMYIWMLSDEGNYNSFVSKFKWNKKK